ncbi:MAG: CoA pyrophosphatase [Xanthomonadales bacterium]|nr:CoA pyrophosphatase [Xanthomonadales bacterium]
MRLRERLGGVLRPLGAGFDRPWNLDELRDLLPEVEALRPAAVLVPLLPTAEEAELLLIRRTDTLPTHPGQFALPGGSIEPGDAGPEAAALREAAEELGCAPGDFEPLGLLSSLVTVSAYRILPVVAIANGPLSLRPDPKEVAEVFRVPLEFFLDPGRLSVERLSHRGRERRVLAYHWAGRRIWGATAAILVDLARRLAPMRDWPC